ncbi:hypothetical protein ACQKWADRAFT_36134 [Trichoderma austrokoningii]
MMDDINNNIGLQTRLSDLSMDGTITVALRQAFQTVFIIKVPLTLTSSFWMLKSLEAEIYFYLAGGIPRHLRLQTCCTT